VEDRDCRHDWYCFGSACLPRFPCDDAADCPFEMQCTNRLCQDPGGCVVQADWADGEVCFWGKCVVLPVQECEHDSDCPQDSICEFGGCVGLPECQVDDDCPAGQRCIGEMCKPYARCDESADPAGCPRGYRCQDGSCIFQAQCESDQDCITLFSCHNGKCTYSGTCQTEADCPFGFACESGACVDQQWCDQETACPDGMQCSANRCGPARECMVADDCDPGSFCSLAAGECRVIPTCPGPDPCQAEPDGPGPYPVGVLTLTFTDAERQRELVTEIWYPASEEARDMPTDKVEMGPGLWVIDSGAHRDAKVRAEAGPCPLIVYSHGGRGWRTQFVSYTVRMASHGYVVMAPNHAGDTFLDPTETDPIQLTTDRVTDVDFMIDQALIINAEAGGPLEGMLDTEHVGATGLCYGGVTALLAAFYVERLTVTAPHAPSGVHHADPEHFQQVTIPVMLFGSELDPDPTPETLLYAFSELGGTSYMAEFLRAGHIHLSDICFWDPFTLEACGPQFTPQRVATEIAMFYNLAFFNRYLKQDTSMDTYLSLEFSARIPEILYWPVR
jgi:dienelactone hydrolase